MSLSIPPSSHAPIAGPNGHGHSPAQQARIADPTAKGAAFGALVSQLARGIAPTPTPVAPAPPSTQTPPAASPPADATAPASPATSTDPNAPAAIAPGSVLDVLA